MRGSKLDEIMTLLFMILAVISVIVVFVSNDRRAFIAIAGVAIVVRLVQYGLRFFKK